MFYAEIDDELRRWVEATYLLTIHMSTLHITRSTTRQLWHASKIFTYAKGLDGIWDGHDKPATLEEALEDLEFVKSQLDTVLDFVHQKGLTNAKQKPPEREIGIVVSRLLRNDSTTNDDLDNAMFKFLGPIRDLSNINHKDALEEAFKVVLVTRNWSHVRQFKTTNRHERHDRQFDELLKGLIDRRSRTGREWDMKQEYTELVAEAEYLEGKGIQGWFEQSRKALETLLGLSTD
ncbi:hypothetical protein B0T21DRAFT_415308 [Apiosordaria backusii]|uniref:Uncharacterized protein n=1 Tax=Apiosordaria backusii TaxID=314023 RepID=A0AA40AIQ9_9PEZI|nr:hypothetical protein B0T21DRAFT_415308 [Apiosordaria backusii]